MSVCLVLYCPHCLPPTPGGQTAINYKTEIQKLKAQIEANNKEFSTKESSLKDEVLKTKKLLNENQPKITNYENKIKELTGLLDDQNKKFKTLQDSKNLQKKEDPPAFLKILNFVLNSQNLQIKNFVDALDKNKNFVASLDEVLNSIKKNYEKVKKKHINEVFGVIKTGKKNQVSLRKLEEFYKEFKYDNARIETSSDEDFREEVVVKPKAQGKTEGEIQRKHESFEIEEHKNHKEIESKENLRKDEDFKQDDRAKEIEKKKNSRSS